MAWLFPSASSLERLAGQSCVTETRSGTGSCRFLGKSMAELYEERPGNEPPTENQLAGLQLVAQRVIDDSLELADELRAA